MPIPTNRKPTRQELDISRDITIGWTLLRRGLRAARLKKLEEDMEATLVHPDVISLMVGDQHDCEDYLRIIDLVK